MRRSRWVNVSHVIILTSRPQESDIPVGVPAAIRTVSSIDAAIFSQNELLAIELSINIQYHLVPISSSIVIFSSLKKREMKVNLSAKKISRPVFFFSRSSPFARPRQPRAWNRLAKDKLNIRLPRPLSSTNFDNEDESVGKIMKISVIANNTINYQGLAVQSMM